MLRTQKRNLIHALWVLVVLGCPLVHGEFESCPPAGCLAHIHDAEDSAVGADLGLLQTGLKKASITGAIERLDHSDLAWDVHSSGRVHDYQEKELESAQAVQKDPVNADHWMKNFGVDPLGGTENYKGIDGQECKDLLGTDNGKNNCRIKYAALGDSGRCHTYCEYWPLATANHGDVPVHGAWYLNEEEPEFQYAGQGHCSHGQLYASSAWVLLSAGQSQTTEGFDTSAYAAWRLAAWKKCIRDHPATVFVSTWQDAGYRCYNHHKCASQNAANTRSWYVPRSSVYRLMPAGETVCAEDKKIHSKEECQNAYNSIQTESSLTNTRGMQEGGWNGVPLDCSVQYQNNAYDQSPHWNTIASTDNSRVTTGEFRIICQLTCSDYACETPDWVKKEGVDGMGSPSEQRCCEPTCESYSCSSNTMVKIASQSAERHPTDATCCAERARCSQSTFCESGSQVPKSGANDLCALPYCTESDNADCCEARGNCSTFTSCATSEAINEGMRCAGNQDACTEAECCHTVTCKEGVQAVFGPNLSPCQHGALSQLVYPPNCSCVCDNGWSGVHCSESTASPVLPAASAASPTPASSPNPTPAPASSPTPPAVELPAPSPTPEFNPNIMGLGVMFCWFPGQCPT